MQKLRKALLNHPLMWYVAVVMLIVFSVPRAGSAGIIPSHLTSNGSRQADVARVQGVLESKVVSQRLMDLGFNPEEVKIKIASFSDADLHQLASHLDQVQGGGDGGLGIIVTLLVIAILFVILLQLTNHRVIVR